MPSEIMIRLLNVIGIMFLILGFTCDCFLLYYGTGLIIISEFLFWLDYYYSYKYHVKIKI